MAYTDATADDLQAAFPKFAAVTDETVEFWLKRARRSVDQTWTEGDYAMGQMLLAAHYMTLEGLGAGAEAESALSGTSDYQTIRSGSLTLTRFAKDGGAASGQFASTSYGRRFLELAKVNTGGPLVTPTGTWPVYPYGWPYGPA